MKTIATFGILLAFAASGCADKSLDDYNQQVVQQDLGKLQAAAGTYAGVVYSQKGNTPMGGLEITLTPQTRVLTSGNNNQKSNEQAVLQGTVNFQGHRQSILPAPDAYFDPGSKHYRTDISVTAPDGSAQTVTLDGVIQNDQFQGTLSAAGYENYGGTFTLKKGGLIPADLVASLSADSEGGERVLVQKTYLGTTLFTGGISKPVELVIVEPRRTPQQDFLSAFYPVKTVQANFNYSDAFQVLHTNATWDQQTGHLTGTTTITNNTCVAANGTLQSVQLNLDCTASEAGPTPQTWNCSEISTQGSRTADSRLSLTSNDAKIPNGGSDSLKDLVETYAGKLDFGNGQTRSAVFKIENELKSTDAQFDELFFPDVCESVTVKLNFYDSFDIALQNIKLDRIAGTMTGEYSLNLSTTGSASPSTTSGTTGVITNSSSQDMVRLVCHLQPAGNKQGKSWACDHYGSSANIVAHSVFTPIQNGEIPKEDGGTDPRAEEILEFTGSGLDNGGLNYSSTLQVTFPERTGAQDLFGLFYPGVDITFDVTLILRDANGLQVTPHFPTTRWKQGTSTLTGDTAPTSGSGGSGGAGGSPFESSLQCANFLFDKQTSPFTCAYHSNQGFTFTLKFNGKPKVIGKAPASTPSKPAKRRKPR